jgi:hypothetical protein
MPDQHLDRRPTLVSHHRSCLSRCIEQHLPIASDPEFVQGTAVMFVRVAVVSDGRPQLRRYALQCVLKAIHNVDDDAQVITPHSAPLGNART